MPDGQGLREPKGQSLWPRSRPPLLEAMVGFFSCKCLSPSESSDNFEGTMPAAYARSVLKRWQWRFEKSGSITAMSSGTERVIDSGSEQELGVVRKVLCA